MAMEYGRAIEIYLTDPNAVVERLAVLCWLPMQGYDDAFTMKNREMIITQVLGHPFRLLLKLSF